MCQVTKNLKLCTCKKSTSQLRNYWLYNRVVEGKEDYIVGEICMEFNLEKALSVSNKKRITRMLNAGTPFDFEIVPLEADELHLHFTTGVSNSSNEINYSFACTKGKWHSIVYDSMMVNCYHETLLQGNIQDGLTRNVEQKDLLPHYQSM